MITMLFTGRKCVSARSTAIRPIAGSPACCLATATATAVCEKPQRVATLLARRRAADLGLEDFGMIGPAPAFFSKVRGKLRWHLLFRADDPAPLLAGVPLTPQLAHRCGSGGYAVK